MRRIDVIAIGLVVFAIGGAGYLGLTFVGVDNINAGIWSQLLLVGKYWHGHLAMSFG